MLASHFTKCIMFRRGKKRGLFWEDGERSRASNLLQLIQTCCGARRFPLAPMYYSFSPTKVLNFPNFLSSHADGNWNILFVLWGPWWKRCFIFFFWQMKGEKFPLFQNRSEQILLDLWWPWQNLTLAFLSRRLATLSFNTWKDRNHFR